MAAVDEAGVRIIYGDASSQVVSFGDDTLSGDQWRYSLEQRGDLVGATITGLQLGGTSAKAHSVFMVVNVDGEVLWRRAFPDARVRVLGMFSDGRALLDFYDFGTGLYPFGHAIVGPDGSLQPLVDFQPQGTYNEDGFIPGWLDGDGQQTGWWDVDNNQFIGTDWAEGTSWRISTDGSWLSVHQQGAASWLVVESPAGAQQIDLGSAFAPGEPPELVAHNATAGWVIIRRPGDDQWWRVAVADGAIVPIESKWPASGSSFFGSCAGGPPVISSDGRVAIPWREASAARLQWVDVETSESTTIGAPMIDIVYTRLNERGGTIVMTTVDPLDTFCAPPKWLSPPPEGTLAGASVQLIRPDANVRHVLPAPAATYGASLSSNGLCALYSQDEQLLLMDVLSGEQYAIDDTRSARWLR